MEPDPHLLGLLQFAGLELAGDIGPYTCYTTKRGKQVYYLRAPPTCPPSARQTRQRSRFALAVVRFMALPTATRRGWEATATQLGLVATGQNLWTHLALLWDPDEWAEIVRRTKTTLTPPTPIPA